MARISITIDPQLKIDLEYMAKANFRTLNGEINKALDWYIKSNLGEAVEPIKEIFTTPSYIVEAPMHTQTGVPVEPISINNNTYDEIEEF